MGQGAEEFQYRVSLAGKHPRRGVAAGRTGSGTGIRPAGRYRCGSDTGFTVLIHYNNLLKFKDHEKVNARLHRGYGRFRDDRMR